MTRLLPSLGLLLCTALASATLAPRAFAQPAVESAFGTTERSTRSLIGILYDLKQTQDGKATPMDIKRYNEFIDKFIASKWDEAVLNDYFRAPLPLYATQVFLPLMPATAAPKAFQVSDVVRPQFWLVHYKGQVSAPESGEWRFWGYGEEVCSIAVNGKNVLLSNWKEITTPTVGWKPAPDAGQTVASGKLRAGDWIKLEKGEVIDLDILIGERGGGVFCAFLLIEKRGETYRMVNGAPILPVFKLAPSTIEQPEAPKRAPLIEQKGPVWIGVE